MVYNQNGVGVGTAGVTWYALSDAGNLNHLVELTITDNGTDFTASANVWLCRIDTGGGGTASALPTLAIMMVMLGGAMGVMGVVVKRERTRLTYWLLAGLLVSGAVLVVSMETGTVEAFTFDPGSLPDCPAQTNNSHITNIHVDWETTTTGQPPTNAGIPLDVTLATFLGSPSHAYTDQPTDANGIATIDTKPQGWVAGKVTQINFDTSALSLTGYNWILVYKLEGGSWQEVGNADISQFAATTFAPDYLMSNNQAYFLLRACDLATLAECQGLATPVPPTATPAPPTPTLGPTSTPIPGSNLPPVVSGCDVVITNAAAKIRRGPNDLDLRYDWENNTTDLGHGTGRFPARVFVVNSDESNRNWYGFVHPTWRTNSLSWVADVGAELQDNNGNSCSVPDFTGQYLPGNNNWTSQPMFTAKPFEWFYQGYNFRGFGIPNSLDYSSIPDCAHPGLDFFASTTNDGQTLATQNIFVRAMNAGTIVGIGHISQVSNDASTGQDVHDSSPTKWGTIRSAQLGLTGNYNIVIRTGGYFVMYGHLASIEDDLYVGKPINAGDFIGILYDQSDNTHLHMEVRTYPTTTGEVRAHFGAIERASDVPTFVSDPMYFFDVSLRGTGSAFTFANPGCVQNTPFTVNQYQNAKFDSAATGSHLFKYLVRNEVYLMRFDAVNGWSVGSVAPSPNP